MTDQEEREIMDEFFETNSYDHVVDWRLMPHLGEEDDDEEDDDDGLRGLGGPTSGHYGHAGIIDHQGGSAPGGSGGEVIIVKKAKAPPATKEQIDTAVKMKADGASYAEIQTETGLNPKQAATIVFKHKKAKLAAKKALANDPLAEVKAKEAEMLKAKAKAVDPWEGATDVKTAPGAAITPPNDLALAGKGYEWKEKTFGPAKGKYAYFKDGVQVSANAENTPEGKAKAAPTINFGKGPDYVAPPPPPKVPKPGSYKGSDLIADVVGKAEETHPWPITDDVIRKKGTTTYAKVRQTGEVLETKLTGSERAAIKDYTGAGSHSLNASLRKGETPTKAKTLDSALEKAVKPPPPDLVWRGIPGVSQHSLISSLESGDVIKLASYQSTSISPDKANSWSSGQTLFEIKPKRGAYVGTISSHPESEYLLPRGANYRVRGATTVMIGHTKRQIIQLEMLDE